MLQPKRSPDAGQHTAATGKATTKAKAAYPWAGLLALIASGGLAIWLLAPEAGDNGWFQTWYLSRAAGLIALALLWLSVSLGLMQSSGLLKGVTGAAANIDVHGFTALLTLYAATFHAWILLWDRFMPFRWTEILLPFALSYEPVLTGLGTLAFYGALGAVVTTYLRGRLTPRIWHGLHQASLIAFALGLLHGYTLGPDSALPAVRFFYIFSGWSTALLLMYRFVGGMLHRARTVS